MKKNLIEFIILLLILKNSSENTGCDFESACTALKIDSSWGLTSGAFPFQPNAPISDHTFKNSTGHYLFFNLNSSPRFENAIISFSQFSNYTSQNIQHCLKFYYIIKSETNANLSVKLIMGDLEEMQPVWLRINTRLNASSTWSLAEINLPKDAYTIRISFDRKESYDLKEILLTLDDIFLSDECSNSNQIQLPEVLYWCDFELDECGFENTMKLEWNRTMASNKEPHFDHTTNSSQGHYLISSPLNEFKIGFIQRVVSKEIYVPDNGVPYCVSFYYYLSSNYPNIYLLAIPLNETSTSDYNNLLNRQIWFTNEQLSAPVLNKWAWAISNLIPGRIRLAFMVTYKQRFDIKTAVDDIKVHSCYAVNEPKQYYDPNLSFYFEYKCDFEQDTCKFSENLFKKDLKNWTRINSHQNLYPELGPTIDHTTQTDDGYYLSVNFSLPITSDFSARIQSVPMFAHRELCFEFFYFANTEIFTQTSKSSFWLSIGGCYAASLFSIMPFVNRTQPQWTRVLIQAKDFACSEFLIFSFYGGDFLKTTFSIDDFKFDLCDKINTSDITTQSLSTFETTSTNSETSKSFTEKSTTQQQSLTSEKFNTTLIISTSEPYSSRSTWTSSNSTSTAKNESIKINNQIRIFCLIISLIYLFF